MWFGIVIIIVGVLLLLKALGVSLVENVWGVVGALVIIAAGGTILTHWGRWARCWHNYWASHSTPTRDSLEELKCAYARGELTREEYEERKSGLMQH
jgi:hypothetical protein